MNLSDDECWPKTVQQAAAAVTAKYYLDSLLHRKQHSDGLQWVSGTFELLVTRILSRTHKWFIKLTKKLIWFYRVYQIQHINH